MHAEPGGVLFLGGCLYDSPRAPLAAESAFPLHAAILGFGAELYVKGR